MPTVIVSDWHLGHYSPPEHGTLARAFLERVRRMGDLVVLNGDIFEGLFEPVMAAQAAHPAIASLILAMMRDGQARRTEGNHDPGGGPSHLILAHLNQRILVMHGHQADPVHGSVVGGLGDRLSRRFGHVAVVRGLAHAAELASHAAAGPALDRQFRLRCLRLVEQYRCDMGVFGHNHRQHLAKGDPYANAGCLTRSGLEYLQLHADGVRLGCLPRCDLRMVEVTRSQGVERG